MVVAGLIWLVVWFFFQFWVLPNQPYDYHHDQ